MRYLVLALILISCTKDIGMKTTQDCVTEWTTAETYGYSEATLQVTSPGAYVLHVYAELTADGCQGITWTFEGATETFALTTGDAYYQGFNTGTPGWANFITMWNTPHQLYFTEPGTLTVRKYDFFKENHRVCIKQVEPLYSPK